MGVFVLKMERNAELERLRNMLAYEQACWQKGLVAVAGIDEAGRGPLAGPVVAAAVMFAPDICQEQALLKLWGLNDSKKLSPKKRALLEIAIKEQALFYAIGWQNQRQIDRYNILEATRLAMLRAIAALAKEPQHLLIDGNPVHDMPLAQTAIVGGDGKSLSIAAASVLVKCFRDRLLEQWDSLYPVYGFAKHKGYGTQAHIEAIATYGPCPLHRASFMPKKLRSGARL